MTVYFCSSNIKSNNNNNKNGRPLCGAFFLFNMVMFAQIVFTTATHMLVRTDSYKIRVALSLVPAVK